MLEVVGQSPIVEHLPFRIVVGLQPGNKPIKVNVPGCAQITISGVIDQSLKIPGVPSQLIHSAVQKLELFVILIQSQGSVVVEVVVDVELDVEFPHELDVIPHLE